MIDVSGTWFAPNPSGANGIAAIGETNCLDHICYAMPDVLGADRARYAGKTIAVLGIHADRGQTAKREIRLLSRFTGANPHVPVVGVPSLPFDV